MGRLLPVTASPVRTIAATRVVDGGTTAPADSEHSTDANPAGLYRTASASPIAAISRFAIRPELDDHAAGRRTFACWTTSAGVPAVKDFIFKVNFVAVVQVRAADENSARQVVPTVLGAPGNAEIGLANQNNAATGHDARVTDVNFSVGTIKPFRKSG
jgi:hypothetical protein